MQRVTFRRKSRASVFKRGLAAGWRAWPLAAATCLGLAGQAIAEDPNIARYGTASASTAWSTQYSAEKGNDNLGTTLWGSAESDTAAWWQVDLGSAFRITRVQVQARQDAVDKSISRRNFEVRGSNNSDGSDYTVLATKDATAFAYKGTWQAEVAEPAAFRYLRVAKTDTDSFDFAEFRAYSRLDVVANNSFETGTIAGWTVTSSDANPPAYIVASDAGTAEGMYALELGNNNAKGNAIVSQTVATAAGVGHTLRFHFGAYGARYKDQVLLAEVLDGSSVLSSQTYTRTSSAAYPAPATFGLFELGFTAASSATTIRFTDQTTLTNSNGTDGMLDLVELYKVNLAVATPTFDPVPGDYQTPQTVTILCATAGAAIRYTVDGTAPTRSNGTTYTAPFEVSHTTTVKAVALLNGRTDSAEANGTYTLPNAATLILLR